MKSLIDFFLHQNLVLAFVSWNTNVNGSATNDLRLVVTSCWTAPLLTKRVRIASREKGAAKIRVKLIFIYKVYLYLASYNYNKLKSDQK